MIGTGMLSSHLLFPSQEKGNTRSFNVCNIQVNTETLVGPGLAQLVERLAHRYSESTSSNPGNLTSATVCGDRTGCMLATKRSASVAPEVDLDECTLPPQKVNKEELTLALKPRGEFTRNPKQGYQGGISKGFGTSTKCLVLVPNIWYRHLVHGAFHKRT